MENKLSQIQIQDYIDTLQSEVKKLSSLVRNLIIYKIKNCNHPEISVIEGEYRPSSFGYAEPPFRVCRGCGYAEEGWGCGYHLLGRFKYQIPSLNRDDAFKFVKIFLSTDQVGELVCKRLTLDEAFSKTIVRS